MRHAGLSASSSDDELLEELDGDPGGSSPEPLAAAPEDKRSVGTMLFDFSGYDGFPADPRAS